MSQERLPPQIITGFVLGGVVLVGLGVYALSLRSENQRLEERLALLESGEAVEITGEVAEGGGEASPSAPSPTEPAPGPDVAPDLPEPSDLLLDEAAKQTLVSQLGVLPPDADKRVWMTITFGDAEAARFASELGQAFEAAGFTVESIDVARFPIRPGIYFMMADAEPPSAVTDILSALEATGLSVTSGRGYRSFYEEKKREDPSWNGFEMAEDQPFVIAIGRDPV